jgi:hypothetical protein
MTGHKFNEDVGEELGMIGVNTTITNYQNNCLERFPENTILKLLCKYKL